MELTQTEQSVALNIARYVIENGRVESGDGGINDESLRVEVSFEAGERGYDDETAEAMATYALEQYE